jgi:endo-1,4-beta-xylanase
MKPKVFGLFLSVSITFLSFCFAQEDVSAQLTPSAIDARISKIRMGDIIVWTKPGAEVKIQQVRHEFLFGTAIPDELVSRDSTALSPEDKKMFLKTLKENFNYAVHENALKWYDCEKEEGVVDYSLADSIWNICHALNIPMRGHCIFWEKDKYAMPWLMKLDNDRLRAAVHRRAIGVTKHFKGRIQEFDLNNEMINGDFFRRRLGYGIVNEMAYMAKAGNPDAILCVNDYGILTDGGFNAATYVMQIRNLLANGVPIGGIGCQSHPSTPAAPLMSPEHVQKTLDTLATFNLPIKITECLFIAATEEAKAQELREIFPVFFAHPGVEAILMWGFWEGDMWKPEAAMWKKDWTPNPIALAYRDLVFNKWWTQVSGKADKEGSFKVHAFYGDYEITSGGQTKKATLSKKDKSMQVSFQ